MTTTKPDLLQLYNDRDFEEIEAILDSAEYTREEKIAMILGQQYEKQHRDKDAEETQKNRNLFSKLCMYRKSYYDYCSYDRDGRLELFAKVLRILGEILGSQNYVQYLEMIISEYGRADEREYLLKIIVDELSDFQFTNILTSLLVFSFGTSSVANVNVLLSSESIKQNILTKKSIKYTYNNSTGRTTGISLCYGDDIDASNTTISFVCASETEVFYENATLLEIALHKHVDMKIIRAFIRAGGKDLLLLSERSLIEGTLIESDKDDIFADGKPVETVKLLLEVGGKDLVMQEKSWHEQDANLHLNIFEFLSAKKEILCPHAYDWDDDIVNIMDMLISTGKKELVMKNNEKGQSILHKFKYFDDTTLLPIVKRIKSIGGNELLSSKDDNGDTVLHTLARYYPQNNSKDFVSLDYWETLACDRDLVMIQNKDGRTALHEACENSEVNAIKALVKIGGKELVWKRDKVGSTALHLLSFRVSREKDADNFQGFKHIVEAGGMELVHSLNDRQKKPMNLFLIEALEFEFDEENKRAKAKALEEKAELDKKAKQDLEEELKAVTKKNEDLEWKWINRKKKQRSDKELEETVKSLKKKLKAQKKSNDTLNDTIKELQKEKESLLMDDKTKEDSNILLKDEIKQLESKQESLQSKIEEKEGLIKTLQDEKKQADLEFEVVKTMHEENKNAYDKTLIEMEKLKELVESQQSDMRDQNEMIQNLKLELLQKDEEYKSRLSKLEEENQRLRGLNDQEKVPDADKPSSIQEESQRLVEEVKADIDEASSVQENRLCSLEEQNKALKDAVKEHKQIADEKQKENNMLKDENERLNKKIGTSCMKRSREEDTEEIDCIEEEDEDDIHCPPSKRGKTTPASSEIRASENTRNLLASFKIENEDLMNDLEYEKASHMKTLKRLKDARKALERN